MYLFKLKKSFFLYTNIPNFMTQDQFICAIQLIKKWEKKVCKIYENSTKIFNKLPLEHSPIGRGFYFWEMPFQEMS